MYRNLKVFFHYLISKRKFKYMIGWGISKLDHFLVFFVGGVQCYLHVVDMHSSLLDVLAY